MNPWEVLKNDVGHVKTRNRPMAQFLRSESCVSPQQLAGPAFQASLPGPTPQSTLQQNELLRHGISCSYFTSEYSNGLESPLPPDRLHLLSVLAEV